MMSRVCFLATTLHKANKFISLFILLDEFMIMITNGTNE